MAELKTSVKMMLPMKIWKAAKSYKKAVGLGFSVFSRELRKARWEEIAAEKGKLVYEIGRGIKMNIYGDSLVCRLIYLDQFEFDERDFVARFLRRGDVFVDVGANVGLFSLIAARSVGPSGRILAFEPTSKTCKRLIENIHLNNFWTVQVERCALSNRTETLEMSVAEDDLDGYNSFAKPHVGEHYAKESVPTVSWDEFASAWPLTERIALMKIDVEGWETNVLTGGKEWLSRRNAPVLQIEFTDRAAKAAGSSCRDNYRILEEMGYKLYRYNRGARTLIRDELRQEYPYLNLFAVKDLPAAQSRLTGKAA